MAIPARQIGWSTKANLLWEISKQLEILTQVAGNVYIPPCPTVDWVFTAGETSIFPTNQDGYTLYADGFTNNDDGQTNISIPFGGTFYSGGTSDVNFYLSTNGYFFGENSGQYMYGNQGDLYLTPGDSLDDGDTQNFWYQNTTSTGKWKTSILVYCGACCGNPAQSTPYSYIINIYQDSQYQYLETVCKSNIGNNAGPDGDTQSASNSTQVWQSPLDGSTWTYLGYGTIS